MSVIIMIVSTNSRWRHHFDLSCVFFRWEQFDKNYLSKLLLRKSVYRKSELWEAYQKINIRDAISVIDQVGGAAHCTPNLLSDQF